MKKSTEPVSDEQAKKIAMQVSWVTIAGNLLLAAGKLAAGIMGRSGAMVSDAIHSASDVFSTFIVMIGVQISARKPDDKHPYGHERFECVASIILAAVLFATGLGIGWNALQNILAGDYSKLAIPGTIALIAAVVSIVVKEAMYWYTRAAAKRINSGALMADAWHHRSDALSSVGAFAGILGSRLGFPVLDSIASLVICFFISYAAYGIFKDAIDKLVDRACDPKTSEQILELALNTPGVLGIDLISTRMFGNKLYVDMEIAADGNRTLYETHAVAEQVHDSIERNFPEVKHCMVHVNPFHPEQNSKKTNE